MTKFFYIALFTLLVSCAEGNWTKDDQNNFVHNCREEGGAKDYCECYMTNVMLEYPIAEDAETIDFEVKIELSKNCK